MSINLPCHQHSHWCFPSIPSHSGIATLGPWGSISPAVSARGWLGLPSGPPACFGACTAGNPVLGPGLHMHKGGDWAGTGWWWCVGNVIVSPGPRFLPPPSYIIASTDVSGQEIDFYQICHRIIVILSWRRNNLWKAWNCHLRREREIHIHTYLKYCKPKRMTLI